MILLLVAASPCLRDWSTEALRSNKEEIYDPLTDMGYHRGVGGGQKKQSL